MRNSWVLCVAVLIAFAAGFAACWEIKTAPQAVPHEVAPEAESIQVDIYAGDRSPAPNIYHLKPYKIRSGENMQDIDTQPTRDEETWAVQSNDRIIFYRRMK